VARIDVGRRLGLAAAAAIALVPVLAAPANAAPNRYTLVHGCYTLAGPSGAPIAGAARLRMQATGLAHYLLYTPGRKFLAAQADRTIAADDAPSSAADWRVRDAGRGRFALSPVSAPGLVLAAGPGGGGVLVGRGAAGRGTRLRFVRARGCAVYPEVGLAGRGRPQRGAVPYGRVEGVVEGHMHWMTFEYLGGNFHCGRPWHAYGVPYALPDCSSIEGPEGTAAPMQNFLNFGNPGAAHDTTGWPKFTEWRPDNLTYEGTYWRWIERAWLGGLRLMVMGINENRVLCDLQANRKTNCNEMDTVRRGIKDMRRLQRYVDAQAGGPGKGFFQIVTDPYQARRVINRGKMAVVLEIEVSEPFDCRGWETSTCDQAQVGRQLDEMYRLGVRSSLLLNKFDNPLTGVRFDSGPIGVLINAANRESSGSFWSAQTCRTRLHDNTIETLTPEGSASIAALLAAVGLQGGTFPAYPPAPHCNTRGLTSLGRHVVRRMMDLHMIVNPDHMSQAGVDDTLTLLESRRYSGVISPHGWMDPGNWPRIWKLGGMAFPGHSTANDYVAEWRRYRPRQTPFEFGWGYGADLGGLSQQPDKSRGGSLRYPFKGLDGRVRFARQRSGRRTFDYAKEGVAHYGLYADWLADLRRIGGRHLASDMLNGAEAYLEMWERADGIRTPGCAAPTAELTARGLGGIRLGQGWRALLRRAGQPQQRTRAWAWCVRGRHNRRAADVAVLSRAGEVELVGSTARGRSLAGTDVGAAVPRPPAGRRVGNGLYLRRSAGPGWVSFVRGGRVRAVAVVSRSLARRLPDLRLAVARLLTAKATQAPPRYVPSRAEQRGKSLGRPLAGTYSPRLNAALAMLCSLPPGSSQAR
jgi:hypothetical protein